MSLLSGLRARLRALARPRTADDDLADEIRFHIELETEKNIGLGMAPDEAKRIATAHFGGVQRAREDHRDVRRIGWLSDLAMDIRFTARSLRHSPAFFAAAVITIALAIGANVAIFSAVNAVVLRPLPFREPDRLVMLTEDNAERRWEQALVAAPNAYDWRASVPAFSDIMMYDYSPSGMTLTGRGDARVLRASYVTGNFFPTLGVRAEIGHALEEADTWDTAPLSVVLSHSAWIREFGGDPSVVGTSIALDGKSYQVVGVMPAGFTFPWDNADMWTGFHWSKNDMSKDTWRRTHWLYAIARLRPGTSVATANAQLQAVAERLRHDHPTTNAGMGAGIVPLHDFLIGDTRRPLTILLAAVGVLLLIACANVGNLLLVRAAGRQREAALRLALGAGHARLVRHANLNGAVAALTGALQREPGNPEANFYLARVKNRKAEHSQAIELMKKALDAAGKRAEYNYWMGRIYLDARKPDEAAEQWKIALQIDPKHADTLEALGRLALDKNQIKQAVQYFERALEVDPTRSMVYAAIGDAYKTAERWDDAIKSYLRALEKAPDLPGVHSKLAMAYYERHKYGEAIEWFKKATIKEPENADAYQYLGWSYKEKKMNPQALSAFKQYLAKAPEAQNKQEIQDQIDYLSGGK